jgi:succinate dehydrogenase/fumarate reductase cytochrome b subunit
MARERNVGVIQGLRYQGGGPQIAWLLHRISGLGIVIFVTTHILASFLGGDIGQFINDIYESWWFQIIVIFCALFHGINGLSSYPGPVPKLSNTSAAIGRVAFYGLWPGGDRDRQHRAGAEMNTKSWTAAHQTRA